MSEWADRYRKLSPESSAEPGQWITARAEYQRGIMDAISDPRVQQVVVMSSVQVGKTEFVLNTIGFHVAHDPAPILVIAPTVEKAEEFSKERLAPMIRDTPAVRNRVADPKSRDSGNTLLHKHFTGGHIAIVGANAPTGLASRPIRLLLADEVDKYPPSAGVEGDPITLAMRRTQNFWNRKIVLVSSPTVKGFSRIEKAWLDSDQRRYFVHCPHCSHPQHLTWAHVKWPHGEPWKARIHCGACGVEWSESERLAAIRWGQWQTTGYSQSGVVGFHLNELYSPWAKLGEMAQTFLEAKRSPETLKSWINTRLGETWEEDAERADGHSLMQRLEGDKDAPPDWMMQAPSQVLVVTAGVDVHPDRIEVERIGWATDEESWSLDYRIIPGDPSGPEIWKELDDYLLTPTVRDDFVGLPVHAACVDSGYMTQTVYRFARERLRRRVYAIKGVTGPGKPIWPKRPTRMKGGLLFPVGVDAAKDAVYARLKVAYRGAGYCHFPLGRDRDYFEQLTAEVVKTKYVRGFPTRVYEKPNEKRNEALDCRVYGYAALQSLNVRWGRLRAAQQTPATPSVAEHPAIASEPPPAQPAPRPPVPVAAQMRRGRRVHRNPWV